MNNIINLIQNPGLLNQMLQRNPNVANMYRQMTNGKSQEEIKEVVKNLCNERHINFNEIEQFVNRR